jgi:hypothetical protein
MSQCDVRYSDGTAQYPADVVGAFGMLWSAVFSPPRQRQHIHLHVLLFRVCWCLQVMLLMKKMHASGLVIQLHPNLPFLFDLKSNHMRKSQCSCCRLRHSNSLILLMQHLYHGNQCMTGNILAHNSMLWAHRLHYTAYYSSIEFNSIQCVLTRYRYNSIYATSVHLRELCVDPITDVPN